MPVVSAADVRAAIAKRTPAPVYLLLGDDEAELSRLAADFTALVEDELRAFNVERIYAGEKGSTAAAIVEAARVLPMMTDRRVVVVFRAERLLKPKRRGLASKPARGEGGRSVESEGVDDEDVEPPGDLDALTDYVQAPVVECWGLKTEKNPRYVDFRQAARVAEQLVRKAVAEAGQQIDPAAARLVAGRAGVDIVRLRGDIER